MALIEHSILYPSTKFKVGDQVEVDNKIWLESLSSQKFFEDKAKLPEDLISPSGIIVSISRMNGWTYYLVKHDRCHFGEIHFSEDSLSLIGNQND